MSPASVFNNSPMPNKSTLITQSTDGSIDSNATEIWARYHAIQRNDAVKNVFVQELIMRYEILSQEYKSAVDNYNTEREEIRKWQEDKQRYAQALQSYRTSFAGAPSGPSFERDPFVLVLLDADGIVFQDEFFRSGELGGRDAAHQLHTAVQHHVQRELTDVPTDLRIVCRVYANVRGLAEVLVRIGVVEEITPVLDFVRGFTRGKTLFDFVDVGPGKDRTDEKLNECFKLYLNDFHCRKIFLGCSHDNGYARILEGYSANKMYIEKIILLEGVPFEKELLHLPFSTQKFPGIFRETKLSVWSAPPSNNRTPPPALGRLWAAKAAVPPPVVAELPIYKPSNREEIIARNRGGQRVDPPCRDYDKAEVDRIKKMKLCNVHFLRHECPFDKKCTHRHDYTPSNSELSTLRLVARMAPCQYGSSCQDIKCIYGHRCPAPEAKKSVKGQKPCIFGEDCKFPFELHNIDCAVVKTLVIR
ncbi:hypothetical protein CC78DRAFT_587336 [Lojkania enalia]|uniref:C3H1-type domain-containing protein n=1 Tax=Lojkania enalia TaxID=147567 RepID=A0A9P4JYQ7_9PLEO|nr:hypothetical protein CC78DRAFT_587336 [Didymosphaeria enalia]